MFKTLSVSILLLGSLALRGQNLVDEDGRKTGHWREEYPNGKTLYEADFVEGQPVGEMVRYYEKGAVKARMIFDPGTERTYGPISQSMTEVSGSGSPTGMGSWTA
jgi:hypothetical protein